MAKYTNAIMTPQIASLCSVTSVCSVSSARDNEMRWPGQAELPIRFVQYTDTMLSPDRAGAQSSSCLVWERQEERETQLFTQT